MSAQGTDIMFIKSVNSPEDVWIAENKPHYFSMKTYELLDRQPLERIAKYKSLLSKGTDQVIRNFCLEKNKFTLKYAAATHQYRLKKACTSQK